VGRRLILDTNMLIAYERGTIERATLDDDDLAIAALNTGLGSNSLTARSGQPIAPAPWP
jgi:hypothetical protein